MGYLLVFTGVALFATIEVAVKDAIAHGYTLGAFQAVTLRFFVTGVILILISFFRGKEGRRVPRGKELLKIGALGIMSGPLAIGLFHYALHLPAMKAWVSATIFSVNPIFIAVIAPFVVHEKLTVREWFGLIMGFGGVVLMSYTNEPGGMSALIKGASLMTLAAFFFSLYMVLSKPLVQKHGGVWYTGWTFLIGGTVAGIISLIHEGLPAAELLVISRGSLDWLYVIIMGTTVAYYCYLMGLSKVNITKGSYIFFSKPFIAFILSLIFLTEKSISGSEIGGFVLIIAGLAVILFVPESQKTVHPEAVDVSEEPPSAGEEDKELTE